MTARPASTPSDDAPPTRLGPVADWAIAASHLIESCAIGDHAPMLDPLWDACDLPKVDLTDLWDDPRLPGSTAP